MVELLAGCCRSVWRSVGGLLAGWWWCARRELVELVETGGTGGGCISLAALAPGFRGNGFHRSGPRWQAGGRRGWRRGRRGHCALCARTSGPWGGNQGPGTRSEELPVWCLNGLFTIERLLGHSLLSVHLSIHQVLIVHY